MASVTVLSDFGTQENKICHYFHFFPIYLPWSDGTRAIIYFFEWWVSNQLFHSPLSPSTRHSLVPLHSLPLEWYHLRLMIFHLAILIPVCNSFSSAFNMMCSAYNLSKYSDKYIFWCTPFPILKQFVVLCPVLIVASLPSYKFQRKQVRWSSNRISSRIFQFVVIHTVKGFCIVNETEVDVFLKFYCFWSLVPLHFLNPISTSGSSWFMYYCSLVWRIFSITLLAYEMSAIVW